MKNMFKGLLGFVFLVAICSCQGDTSASTAAKPAKEKPKTVQPLQAAKPAKESRKKDPKTEILNYAKRIVKGQSQPDRQLTKKLLPAILKYRGKNRNLMYNALLVIQKSDDKAMNELIGGYQLEFAELYTEDFIGFVDEMEVEDLKLTAELIGFQKMLDEDDDELKNTKAFIENLQVYRDDMINPEQLDAFGQSVLGAAKLNYE